MTQLKDQMLRLICRNARATLARLASELAGAASEEKEQILAGVEFERWLADTCAECLGHQEC